MRLALGLLTLATACGDGGPNLQGFYMTTGHTLNDQGCGGEGADQSEPPYLRIVEEDLFGIPIQVAQSCTSEDEADCSESGDLGFFATQRDGGFIGETFVASGGVGGAPCLLGYQLDRAVREDDTIRIERRRFEEEDETLQEDACSTDEAEARGDSMPCVELEVLEGALLAP